LQLSNGGRYRVSINAELLEMLVGTGELSVIHPTVTREFDFQAIEDFARSQAEHSEGRRRDHLDQTGRERPADLCFSTGSTSAHEKYLLA
jgi:hypothetical protein